MSYQGKVGGGRYLVFFSCIAQAKDHKIQNAEGHNDKVLRKMNVHEETEVTEECG
jgi:hypothetical protein